MSKDLSDRLLQGKCCRGGGGLLQTTKVTGFYKGMVVDGVAV